MKIEHIAKSHNRSLLLYDLVCSAKYRRKVFSKTVEKALKRVCDEISKRYVIYFVEIDSADDHVHFMVQSVPMYSPKKIVNTVKSIAAIEIFKLHPEVKTLL